MKRFLSTNKFRALTRKRQRKSLRKNNKKKAKDAARNGSFGRKVLSGSKISLTKRPRRSRRAVYAPEELSLVSNPEETLKFIGRLEAHHARREPVNVRLENVTKISLNGILVLLSVMVKFRQKNIHFNGTMPFDENCKARLEDSGFFEQLYENANFNKSRKRFSFYIEDRIKTHGSNIVDAKLASELLLEASCAVWGEKRRCTGAQTSLVELMTNTNNHADPNEKGKQMWWVSVSKDNSKEQMTVAFVDYGIGILKSLNTKGEGWSLAEPFRILKNKLKHGSEADMIREILNGALHRTSAGKPYRGRGLPSVYESSTKRMGFRRLHIISNGVFVDVDSGIYRTLRTDFSGTFVYFVVDKSCRSLPYEECD